MTNLAAEQEIVRGLPWAWDVLYWRDRARTVPRLLQQGRAWLTPSGSATPALALAVLGGRVLIEANRLGLRLTDDETAALAPGRYQLKLQRQDDAGGWTELRGIVVVTP